MNMQPLLIGFAGISVVWGIVAGMLIFEYLKSRGEKVSFIWIRLFLPIYVHKYAKITRAESGKPGPLFYHYLFAFNFALFVVIVAAIL